MCSPLQTSTIYQSSYQSSSIRMKWSDCFESNRKSILYTIKLVWMNSIEYNNKHIHNFFRLNNTLWLFLAINQYSPLIQHWEFFLKICNSSVQFFITYNSKPLSQWKTSLIQFPMNQLSTAAKFWCHLGFSIVQLIEQPQLVHGDVNLWSSWSS